MYLLCQFLNSIFEYTIAIVKNQQLNLTPPPQKSQFY